MIEEGTYRAKARRAQLGSTSTGKEQVAVEFEIAEPQTRIVWYGYFTEKTVDSTIKALRTCGWQGDDLSDLAGIDANEVELVIEHERDDRGFPRPRVRWVNSTGGLALKSALDPAAAKTFAARMKGAIVAWDRANGVARPAGKTPAPRPARPAPRQEELPAADDDIPF